MNLYSVSSLIAFIVCLYLGLFVYLRDRRNSLNKSFSIATISMGIWSFFPFLAAISSTPERALFLTRLAYIAAMFTPVGFLKFTFVVLGIQEKKREKKIVTISCIISFCLIIFLCFNPNFIKDVIRFAPFFTLTPGFFYPIFILYFGIICTYVVYTAFQVYQEAIGYKRNQLRYLFLSFFIAYAGGILHFLSAYIKIEPFPHDFFIISYALLLFYAIFKYRLLDITVAITRAGLFIVVYTLVLGLPFAISIWGKVLFIELLGPSWWMAPLGLMAILATGGPFIYIYLESRAEEALLKEQRRYQKTLKQASVGMTRIRNLRKLLDLITHIVVKSVRISYVAVYLYDEQENAYVLQLSRDKGRIPLSSLAADSPLISYLIYKRDPLIYEEIKRQMLDENNKTYSSLEQNMKLLTASVIIPSFLEDKLMGFFVLGDKISGQIYTVDDLNVFQVLASQAALAIENAKFYEETKELHEQISQAEKMATIGTMADGLSHQINNRFYALSLIASDTVDTIKLTDTASCTPEVKQMISDINHALERIQANVMQGGEVVRGMLKYTRRGEEGFEPLELNKLLDNTLEMVQFKVRVSELDIIRDFNHIPKINGNMTQLEEAFFNFIDNANDAIAERRAILKEEGYRGRITISAKQKSDEMLEIIVEDNGMGVKYPDAKKVFTPFFTTKISSRKGTGLGLYVIKRIITEIHNGKISFESEHKIGTRFIIELPISRG